MIDTTDDNEIHDVVVVGAGAAGLNAALVLGRARRRAVIDGGEPRNAPAAHMHGFLSWAAGNVVDPRAQVVTAAGMGSAAAFAINTDLLDEDVERAVERHRAAAAAAAGGTVRDGGDGR